jgi:NADH dehydrogenase
MQTGLYTGHRLRHRAAGNLAEKPFRYHDLGSAAYISRGQAVVKAGPLQMSGVLGWVSWLFIHIAFLTGYRNRAGALLTWWLAFARNLRRERSFTTQQLETRDVYTLPLGRPEPESGDQSSADPSGVSGGGKAAHP